MGFLSACDDEPLARGFRLLRRALRSASHSFAWMDRSPQHARIALQAKDVFSHLPQVFSSLADAERRQHQVSSEFFVKSQNNANEWG
jgi:hypothetical protein